MRVLSPVEQAYLNGTREFTKAQQRYIRCRLKKKLRLLDAQSCNAAARLQRLEEEWGASLVRIPPIIVDNERVKEKSSGPGRS